VEEGLDIADIAAAAARLAGKDKPLEVALEPPARDVSQTEDGMVRLFIPAGSRAGVRPADIVGAIANEADVPGKAIGAIDIYDSFTFVEVPARYGPQVLERMSKATIRGRQVEVRVATPGSPPPNERGGRPGPPDRRPRPSGGPAGRDRGKKPFVRR
jgi:ATP-dependent RNA helicase DeaD